MKTGISKSRHEGMTLKDLEGELFGKGFKIVRIARIGDKWYCAVAPFIDMDGMFAFAIKHSLETAVRCAIQRLTLQMVEAFDDSFGIDETFGIDWGQAWRRP